MKKIYDLIKILKETSSTKSKLEILSRYESDADVKEYMRLVHSSEVTLGVAKVPIFNKVGDKELDLSTLGIITEKLAKREYTGSLAVGAITTYGEILNEECQHLLSRWVERSLDAGVSVSTINKVWPELIRVQPYMRCMLPTDTDLTKWDWSKGVYVQTKEDGAWGELRKESIRTRAGNNLVGSAFDFLLKEVNQLNLPENKELHGEVLIFVDGIVLPREKNNGRINALTQGDSLQENEKIAFVAWDMVTIGKIDKTPYETRFENLRKLLGDNKTIRVVEYEEVFSLKDAMHFYRKQLALKREGAVVKRKDGIWKSGNSDAQIKLKIIAELDLKVVGFKEGKGKYASTFGSIELQSECGRLAVSVSGIKDNIRKQIHDNRDSHIGKVVTIKANGIQYGESIHSLFLPRFVEVRDDKDKADDFNRIEKIFESIMFSSSE